MEGERIWFISLLFLVALLAASGLHPIVGLRFKGERKLRGRELDCCDECKCSSGMRSCVCADRLSGGCRDGCRDCRRERGLYLCRDVMEFCPESCDYDYWDAGA